VFNVEMCFAAIVNNYGQEITGMAHKILMGRNLCSSYSDCSNKKLVFFSRKKGGTHLEVYGIENKDVLLELISLVISEYYSRNREIDIDIAFYEESHENMMGFKKFYIDPFIKIDLKRGE